MGCKPAWTFMLSVCQTLIDNIPAICTFLCCPSWVDCYLLSASTISLADNHVYEFSPGGVHYALCEIMISDHILYAQLLVAYNVIIVDIVSGYFMKEVVTLVLNPSI